MSPPAPVSEPIFTDPPDTLEAPEAPGWAGRVMAWLRIATLLVWINILMLLGCLAGLVLLGIFPALAAGSVLLAELAEGRPPERVWAEFWREWRDGLGRINVLAAPWWLIGLLLLADLDIALSARGTAGGVLLGSLVVLTGYLAVAFAFFLAAIRRYDDPIGPTWRFVLVSPLLAPVTGVAIVAADVLLFLAFASASVLVPLFGLAAPVLVTGWLADRRLDRMDARAEARAADRAGDWLDDGPDQAEPSPNVDSRGTIS